MCYNTDTMTKLRLVLASRSPRRRELLHLLELPFELTVSEAEENTLPEETPIELVTRLSRKKACYADLDGHQDALVIGCDTIVALGDEPQEARILGKPRDSQEAAEMLRILRGRSHMVYSAVTVLQPNGRALTKLVTTRLTMRQYTEDELATYVASGDPLDKAGAYAIQHEGFHPVREIEGCYTSVMGLPLCHLTQVLRRVGCSPTVDVPAVCQAHTGRRCMAYEETIER